MLAPRSALFPYTTLFRSPCAAHGGESCVHGASYLGIFQGGLEADKRNSRSHDRCPGRKRRDRKSTRLNSSHRCISYAVFCLKKKMRKSICSRLWTSG